ncbi:MAG: biotin/lipoyl-containing protein [Bacteroidota bacterium]
MQNYKATVGNFNFELTEVQIAELDSIPNADGSFHLLKDNKAYQIEAKYIGRKRFEILVNGNKYEVQLADEKDMLVERLGLGVRAASMAKEVVAPMPGLVLSIAVSEGQSVAKGDALLILEAMKMENVIKAAGDGVVKSISVQQGAAVEKGAVLLDFE